MRNLFYVHGISSQPSTEQALYFFLFFSVSGIKPTNF